MPRTQRLNLFFALFVAATLVATLSVNSSTLVQATPTASDSMDVQVDHAVQIRNGGLTVINDTVKLVAEDGELDLTSFTLGFPFIYRSSLDYVFAYDASNSQLEVKLDVALGKIGFYGVEVGFPQSIRISNGESYEFTVVFIFSNLISFYISPFAPEPEGELIEFNATFPAYPSLIQTASTVNLTIALPSNVDFRHHSLEKEGVEFTNETIGTLQIFNYTKEALEPFAYKPFWVSFEGMDGSFLILEAKEVKRDIRIGSSKSISLSDSYEVTTKAGQLSQISVQLLQSAYEITAWDSLGNPYKTENIEITHGNATTPTQVTLSLSSPRMQNESALFELTYQIPWENAITQSNWQNYHIAISSFENFNWTIRKLVITLALPEGAEFLSLPDSGMVQKSAFQDTMNFAYYNVTPFQDLSQEIIYEYAIFWASFRPTLWVGTGVAILSVIAFLWRAPRPMAPIPTIPIKPEELKSYVDAYEQKRQNLSKLETLEERTRKRKIPRRRYRVRKRTLESRLSILIKDLGKLKDKLQAASPKYADMMRQIEIAEADIEGIEAGIRRTETRYRRGEISTAVYHKLLEDYYRRRERARTTIDGIIIRLREEIA